MAALDDLVGAVVFFAVIAFVSSTLSVAGTSFIATLAIVFAPVLIGAVRGVIAGFVMRHTRSNAATIASMLALLLATALFAMYLNENVLTGASLNFMLLGMAFSTAFANMIPKEKLDGVMRVMNPVISFSLILLILNLGAPLDYHLVFGAGIYTAVYIVSRAVGKYFGAYVGAAATQALDTVKKYLGFTLLPHSGVSPRVHGHIRVRTCGSGPGVRAVDTGYDSCRSGYKRDHCRIHRAQRLRVGRRAWQSR